MNNTHKKPFDMTEPTTTTTQQTLTPRSSWPSLGGTWGGGPCCGLHGAGGPGSWPGTSSGHPCHPHCLWCCSGFQRHCCLCCASMCLPDNHKFIVVCLNHSQKINMSLIYVLVWGSSVWWYSQPNLQWRNLKIHYVIMSSPNKMETRPSVKTTRKKNCLGLLRWSKSKTNKKPEEATHTPQPPGDSPGSWWVFWQWSWGCGCCWTRQSGQGSRLWSCGSCWRWRSWCRPACHSWRPLRSSSSSASHCSCASGLPVSEVCRRTAPRGNGCLSRECSVTSMFIIHLNLFKIFFLLINKRQRYSP